MSSGVIAHDECVLRFQDLKLGHSLRYIVYKLSDDLQNIVVEKVGPPNSTYDQFVHDLPPNDCRYAVFDFDYTAEDGGTRNKIVFVLWTPESSKIKSKMLYTSSKDGLRQKLVGVAVGMQATDLSEIDYEAVKERVLRK